MFFIIKFVTNILFPVFCFTTIELSDRARPGIKMSVTSCLDPIWEHSIELFA